MSARRRRAGLRACPSSRRGRCASAAERWPVSSACRWCRWWPSRVPGRGRHSPTAARLQGRAVDGRGRALPAGWSDAGRRGLAAAPTARRAARALDGGDDRAVRPVPGRRRRSALVDGVPELAERHLRLLGRGSGRRSTTSRRVGTCSPRTRCRPGRSGRAPGAGLRRHHHDRSRGAEAAAALRLAGARVVGDPGHGPGPGPVGDCGLPERAATQLRERSDIACLLQALRCASLATGPSPRSPLRSHRDRTDHRDLRRASRPPPAPVSADLERALTQVGRAILRLEVPRDALPDGVAHQQDRLLAPGPGVRVGSGPALRPGRYGRTRPLHHQPPGK